MMNLQSLAFSFAVMIMSMGQARANLVLNGSFENPNVIATETDGLPYYYYTITGTSLDHWALFGSPLVVVDSRPGAWVAAAGNQYINLQSAFAYAIEQTLTTVPGTQYKLRFAYAPEPDAFSSSSTDRSVNVRWGGALVANVTTSDATVGDLNWSYHEYLVTATGASTVLRFEDGTAITGFIGPYLDDVSVVQNVSAVPESASFALLSLATLGGIGLRFRRNRKMQATA